MLRLCDRACCLFTLALVIINQVKGFCSYQCECPDEPKSCRVGVSLMDDGCNCCKVCAKQAGEQCNGEEYVCDVHHNLFCDFTASKSGDWGVCKARSGKACFHDGILVKSGSMFKPSCKKKCWCIDGAIACLPTCPHETQTPRPDRCHNAKLRSTPGQCCDQWTCEYSSGEIFPLPLEEFWKEYVDDLDDVAIQANPSTGEMANGVREGVIYEDDVGENGDELIDYQIFTFRNLSDDYSRISDDDWHDTNVIPGDIHAYQQLQASLQDGGSHCSVQASSWSPCSKSCGLGVSIRVTNNNPGCRLKREQRLCEIRPCSDDERYLPKKGQQCLRHRKSRKRSTFKYAGCESLKKIKPRYCGSCLDENRCCTPKMTRTSRVRFQCDDGRMFVKNIMVVRGCHCHRNCFAGKSESTAAGEIRRR